MMLNHLPKNTPLSVILSYLHEDKKNGSRDRALFAARQHLRIKDIAQIQVCDVLNHDGRFKRHFTANDATLFEITLSLQSELTQYLLARFGAADLREVVSHHSSTYLFATQKRANFSANTLAQHFSYLDKRIHERFAPQMSTTADTHGVRRFFDSWKNRALNNTLH